MYARISGCLAYLSVQVHSCSSCGENEYEYSMLSTSQRAPGVAVPEPGAADAVTRLEDPSREPEFAETIELV
jgi:hypothetical protein